MGEIVALEVANSTFGVPLQCGRFPLLSQIQRTSVPPVARCSPIIPIINYTPARVVNSVVNQARLN